VEAKLVRAREHFNAKQRSLFTDILQTERSGGTRMVAENDGYALFCPFASRFPFELAVFPRRHSPDFVSCSPTELYDLAEIVRFALQRLSTVLEKPGYNILLHTAPLKRPLNDRFASAKHDYCWHLEIVPRFHSLAGFEIGLGAYINTVYPEDAARFLRGEVRA
jgi:UDPglucose--hexose-1-phosphate uridylyltransferase